MSDSDSNIEDSTTDFTLEESTEDSEPSPSEGESDSDVDLEELYDSFAYDDSSQASSRDNDETSSYTRYGHGLDETTLYSGAQLTVFQSYLLIFQYSVRHSLSRKAFAELLQLISVHAPQGAAIPKSVYSIKRYFAKAFPDANSLQHVYCSSCQRSLTSVDSSCGGSECQGGRPAMFITLPLGLQIKRKMES